MTYEEWYAKRDAIHDLICDEFGVGSDTALPLADRAMEQAAGPCPPKPAPEATIRVYTVDGDGKDLLVSPRVPAFSGLTYASLGLGFPNLFMDAGTVDQLVGALQDSARWLREYPERAAA